MLAVSAIIIAIFKQKKKKKQTQIGWIKLTRKTNFMLDIFVFLFGLLSLSLFSRSFFLQFFFYWPIDIQTGTFQSAVV